MSGLPVKVKSCSDLRSFKKCFLNAAAMLALLLSCASRSTTGMFVCPSGSLPCESRGQCTPQVASVSPPPGSDVGDVTDTAQLMFLVILPGGRIICLEHYLDFVFCS